MAGLWYHAVVTRLECIHVVIDGGVMGHTGHREITSIGRLDFVLLFVMFVL